jgi:DNA-binding IclR family transcriptional regulator
MGENASNPVKSVETAFEVLEALRRLDGAGVTAVATELDVPKSTAYNHLETLEQEEYVVKEGSEYYVGLRFLDLGRYARQREGLYETARPELESLAEETGELVNLLVEEHGLGVYLCRVRGDRAVNVAASTGTRVYLHSTALGKAILAHSSESHVEDVLSERGMPAETERTTTDPDELRTQLTEIRDRGVAFDREERLAGLCCAAVPVIDDDGRPIAAISVSGPKNRMKGDRLESEIPELLASAANVVELNLTYS